MTKFAIIHEEVVEVEVLHQARNYALVQQRGMDGIAFGDQPVKVIDLFDEKVDALTEVCVRLKRKLKQPTLEDVFARSYLQQPLSYKASISAGEVQ